MEKRTYVITYHYMGKTHNNCLIQKCSAYTMDGAVKNLRDTWPDRLEVEFLSKDFAVAMLKSTIPDAYIVYVIQARQP